MQFQLPIQIKPPEKRVSYPDKILLTGSCFTENIGNALAEHKFIVSQNPHGILFDPGSVCSSLSSYISNHKYSEADLFYLNEVWNSWDHHSRFSNIDKEECLQGINDSQQKAHDFLKQADWLIITLGSSFCYLLKDESSNGQPGKSRRVANCHRAPSQWFDKHLNSIEETTRLLEKTIRHLKEFNTGLKIIFTISPVRHIRDGVIENNRSKARLIEAVHSIVNKFQDTYYFPAYELVIDVLRDYRFYDVDMVHPNYPATEFVMEKFRENYINEESQLLMDEVRKIMIAAKHKAFFPDTNAHKDFLRSHLEKAKELQAKYPFIDFKNEINYFNLPA